jgi:hypothetical protein
MPYRSTTGGFTGNGNMGDFIDQVVSPFLTDAKGAGGLGWISQIGDLASPARVKGSSPDFEFMFSRGTVGAEAPPYWFCQTASKTLFIYSGNGVDRTQESFDQPGNPVNEPLADPPVNLPTNGVSNSLRCLAMTTMPGPYDSYWVFGGETAEYLHVVVKVAARQYRHFHVGMLTPFDTSLDPDTFYVTNQRWSYLDPDNLEPGLFATSNTTNAEHQPYFNHVNPFSNSSGNNNLAGANDGRSVGMWLYSPNYGTQGYDWWMMTGNGGAGGPFGGGTGPDVEGEWYNYNQPASVSSTERFTKTSVGDVNMNTDAESPQTDIRIGCGFVAGNNDCLGTTPWACDPTFTTDGVALVPIIVGLHSDFASALRWGPVGQVPDVFRVNMKSLDAEQEITIGSDTYIVFPLINKDANNTVAGEGYSGYEGLAYRKITANAT